MEYRVNQKVRVIRDICDDGTCAKCSRGKLVASEHEEGFVKDITEFLFEKVIVVHFLEKDKVVGFRENELEIIEDYDCDNNKWIKMKN